MIMLQDKKKLVQGILGPVAPEKPIDGGDEKSSLHTMCDELIEAVHSKSCDGVLSSLKAIFQELDMEPHEEYGEG